MKTMVMELKAVKKYKVLGDYETRQMELHLFDPIHALTHEREFTGVLTPYGAKTLYKAYINHTSMFLCVTWSSGKIVGITTTEGKLIY